MELLLPGTNARHFDVYVVYHPPVSIKKSGRVTDVMTELLRYASSICL